MPNSLQLGNLVQQLKLTGISDSLESRLRQAKDAELPYEELLSMLLQDELDSRDHSSLQRRIIHNFSISVAQIQQLRRQIQTKMK